MSWLGRLAWRLSLHPVPPNRGVLIVTDEPSELLVQLLARLRAAHPRINLFLQAGPRARPIAGVVPVPLPLAWAPVIRRFLRRLKLQAIVIAGDVRIPDALLPLGMADGVKVITIKVPDRILAPIAPRIALRVTADTPSGIPSSPNPATGTVLNNPDANTLFEHLAPLLVTERAPGRDSRSLEKFLIANLERPPLAWFTFRKFDAVESIPALVERLDHPRSILCLGNGPSSEDPELAGIAYDALFRVNHSWLDRFQHTSPAVIFTGKTDTLRAYRRQAIFGFQTVAAARRSMLRWFLQTRRITYFSAEQLGCINFDRFLPYTPTNGAVMIATAAALRPERLIIGGVDLFSDPRGSYPGDGNTPNAYTMAHDRNVETHFILETLAAFEGEVVVVGKVLKECWERFRSESA